MKSDKGQSMSNKTLPIKEGRDVDCLVITYQARQVIGNDSKERREYERQLLDRSLKPMHKP